VVAVTMKILKIWLACEKGTKKRERGVWHYHKRCTLWQDTKKGARKKENKFQGLDFFSTWGERKKKKKEKEKA